MWTVYRYKEQNCFFFFNFYFWSKGTLQLVSKITQTRECGENCKTTWGIKPPFKPSPSGLCLHLAGKIWKRHFHFKNKFSSFKLWECREKVNKNNELRPDINHKLEIHACIAGLHLLTTNSNVGNVLTAHYPRKPSVFTTTISYDGRAIFVRSVLLLIGHVVKEAVT